MKKLLMFGLIGLFIMQTGCASLNRKLKAMLGGEPQSPVAAAPKEELTTYSQSTNLPPTVKRKYKRQTRESLEDEALLGERSGSLWVMEGQGSYLFSQNIMRMIGDPLAVALDGDPKDQLVAKVEVIRDLLQKLEDRQKARLRGPASADGAQTAPGTPAPAAPAAAAAAESADAAKDDKDFNVKNVPTRIVERTTDGNYRVKGEQPFMIKGREYKVIVTGVVRAEDFNDAGIPATKLLDSKYDIVSVKRSEATL